MGGSAVEPLFFNLPVICRLEEGERVHACPFARSRHLVSMSLVSKMVNFETKLDEIGNRRKNRKKLRSPKASEHGSFRGFVSKYKKRGLYDRDPL